MNPRYLAYCKANGNTPDAQMAADEIAYPGGKMCGFILFIGQAWAEYNKLKGWPQDYPKSDEDHREFTAWLAERSERLVRKSA